MSLIAVLLIIAIIGLSAFAGVRDGAFFTAYALLRNLFGFLLAMTLCEPLARWSTSVLPGGHPAYDYYVLIWFALVFGLFFAGCRWLKMHGTAPYVALPNWAHEITGGVLGLLSGLVVTGTLLILWSLMPFVKYIPGDAGHVNIKNPAIDTGAMMLRFYGFVEERFSGGRAFLLEDEPLKVDKNENQRADPGDAWVDLLNNGRWDRGWLWRYRRHASVYPSDLEPLRGVLEEQET